MARPLKYTNGRRVNVLLEAELHDFAAGKAKAHRLQGGFSEYVARLIAADRNRKGIGARRAA